MPLIETRGLKKYFPTAHGMLHAVDDVNLSIEEGETLGVVGESGCGKSTLGRTIIHLLDASEGQVLFDGKDVTNVKGKELSRVREKMQIIFQDPYSSIDPRKTVKETIQEPLIVSKKYTRSQVEEEAERVMDLVGLDMRLRNSYPHELDGGRRQRVGIGRALALNPRFIVCDEPVSALDVSIQAQVLNLLKKLQKERKLTYMFVTHDMSVVRHISTSICVMYLGQMVEKAPSKELFEKTWHPYTKALLDAIPSVDIHNPRKRDILRGELTSPINPQPGCRFLSRCKYACDRCKEQQKIEQVSEGHYVSCCRVREINQL